MKNLELVKSAAFGEVQCDIYRGDSELYMTRQQIGEALEYKEPRKAIKDIHSRHKDRLDPFSTPLKLRGVEGGADCAPLGGNQQTVYYTRKGIMEICRWSEQPKADAFMDWVWEIMDSLISGRAKIIDMTEYQRMMMETRAENTRVRKAQLLRDLSNKYKGTTYSQILDSYATRELTGEHLLPLPKLEARTLTAQDVGNTLGITANKVGTLTNRHNLKTDEYGKWFHDKSRHSSKEVQSFRYFESVIPVLREILKSNPA